MRKAVLLSLLLTTSIAAQTVTPTIEERLARLEQEVRELREENRALRAQLPPAAPVAAPAPAPKAEPALVRAAGKESQLSIGGYLQGQAEAGDRVDPRFSNDNDRMFVRRARVNAVGRFAEDFGFKVEADLAGSLGNSSGMRAQTSDAYVEWTRHPFAEVRFGQFKTPFGIEQLWSDTRLFTPERTLGTDRITAGRQLGVQLSGDFANDRAGYAIGVFNGNGTNVSFNDDEGFMTAGRFTARLLDGDVKWNAGVNGYTSDDVSAPVASELDFENDRFAGTRRAWGADTQFTAGPLELWAEWMQAKYDPSLGSDRELTAAYLLGVWSLTSKLQAVARYDTYDAETTEIDTWTVGGNYLIKGNDLKLQLNLMHSDEGDRVVARVQTVF